MNFNDTYQADDSNSDNLEADLSELGEVLAERFDLEDQLLEALYLYNT
jgi:regulator of sigma D